MSNPVKQPTVDPNQNVSPIASTHFDPTGQVSGASIAAKGGTPLRLSVAITMAQALASNLGPAADQEMHSLVADAFKYADLLIAKYNESGNP